MLIQNMVLGNLFCPYFAQVLHVRVPQILCTLRLFCIVDMNIQSRSLLVKQIIDVFVKLGKQNNIYLSF